MWNFLASKNFQKILPDKTHTHKKKPPKKVLSKFSHPKKSRNWKFKPKKIIWSPPPLEIRSTPPGANIKPSWLNKLNQWRIYYVVKSGLFVVAPVWEKLRRQAGNQKKGFTDILPTFGSSNDDQVSLFLSSSLFFFFLLLSNFAPHSTIWMLVFLQGVRLVSSKQTPMYCKVNFQYKNIASKRLIWLSRVHFRKKKKCLWSLMDMSFIP